MFRGLIQKKQLEKARSEICSLLFGDHGKLFFTSSATESNNWVFKGLHLRKGQTVLISSTEHPSVLNSALELLKQDINVLQIPVMANGKIDEEKFKNLLENEPVALVSIIHVSNETGQINDIKKLASLTKKIKPNAIFHSDGVQAFGKIKVNLQELGVDLYTISAHKIHSLRGIAGLWIKNGIFIDPLIFGGGQEGGLRSSTENVAGAIAFSFAAKKMCNEIEKNYEIITKIKDEFLMRLKQSKISKFLKINSDENCSPFILSLSFDGIKGEVLMNLLQSFNILISTGSACSSKKSGNRVLSAMGIKNSDVVGSVRISFSPYEKIDTNYILDSFEKTVLKLEENVKR